MSYGPSTSGQGPSPYSPPSSAYFEPPRRSSSAWIYILAAFGMLGLLVCCGGGALLTWFGKNVGEEEITAQLRDNPKLREHIGEIKNLDMDFVASGAQDDSDVFVYNVEGSKSSGRLTIRESMDDDFSTIVEEATLRLPDGSEVKVVP